ncbi:MAG: hypothetical protein IKB25_13515 [Lentisphaeria bacterium]|nr:hypothetical protein [Lentisphaeria bacterium]
MKNTTKALTACLLVFAGTAVFAHGPGHGHHHHGNDGVRLATDIVNLVGASLNVLTGGPVYVTPPPRSSDLLNNVFKKWCFYFVIPSEQLFHFF